MLFRSRRGEAGSGAASGWNKVGAGGGASSAPSECTACCSAASASVFDLRGARRPEDAAVDDDDEAVGAGGGGGTAEEKGEDLAVPEGCGIGMAPWTGISRDDINVVGGLGATGEPTGLARGVALSASAVRARRGVPRADCAGEDRCMDDICKKGRNRSTKNKLEVSLSCARRWSAIKW